MKDGLVRRIRYGSEPLMQNMQSGAYQQELKTMLQMPEVKKQLEKDNKGANSKILQSVLDKMKNMPTVSLTTETYYHIIVGQPINSAVFTAKVPSDWQVQELSGGSLPQPPVVLGKLAPEINVTDLDGVKHKLADFKGKVVLIDFWATWCAPCRKGLPETQKLFADYGNKGLAVMTISDESKSAVVPFIRQNKFTFPVYLDPGSVTNKDYHIKSIPTIVVIDKKGNLVAYMVGLTPSQDILTELKKAGLQLH